MTYFFILLPNPISLTETHKKSELINIVMLNSLPGSPYHSYSIYTSINDGRISNYSIEFINKFKLAGHPAPRLILMDEKIKGI